MIYEMGIYLNDVIMSQNQRVKKCESLVNQYLSLLMVGKFYIMCKIIMDI